MSELFESNETTETINLGLESFYLKLPGGFKWELMQERKIGQDIVTAIEKTNLDLTELARLQSEIRGTNPEVSTTQAKINLDTFIQPLFDELIKMGYSEYELKS